MKEIKLNADLSIFPADPGEEVIEEIKKQNDGQDPQDFANAKELIFTDMQCGEVIRYTMTGELATLIARRLKMSNKSLKADLEEEAQRARARAMLAGGNGGQIPPEAKSAAQDILRGIHTSDN